MIRFFKWAGALAGASLVVACFFPWVYIESRQLILTGMDTAGTNFGKPGFLHIILAGVFVILHFIPALWAKRTNLIVAAINLAWAIRNYFLITSCSFGECPIKKPAVFVLLVCSIIMMGATLFPDMKPVEKKTD